ncbi:MAG: GNAT family N-acetyltransferase [Acidimicrobiales bacterium]
MATVATVAVPAGPGDIEALSDVLQAAFWDDPVMAWLLPSEKSRSRKLAGLFQVLMKAHYLSMRTTWTTADQVGGALWAPPGHWKIPNWDVFKAGPGLAVAMGLRSIPALRFLEVVDRQHPKEPHWYLGILGTSPAHQGKGVGSALMQPVLERCDREGVPAYLESSKETNIPFYSRHGFVLTGEISAPGGPTVWPMWREPQG